MNELKDLRYERKFVVENLDNGEIEYLIKHNPKMFSEIFYKRVVNNIYLDSLDFKNYKETLSGSAQRVKIRIRWYGKTFGLIRKPVLELKIKNNELGKKLSFSLKPFIFDKKFSWNLLKKVFLESNLPLWLIEKLKLYPPALLNSYTRKYFRSFDKKYRITLDWDLAFCKIRPKNNMFNYKIIKKGFCVLEIKYPSKHYEKVSEITNHFPFRLVANSKYVYGLDILEL